MLYYTRSKGAGKETREAARGKDARIVSRNAGVTGGDRGFYKEPTIRNLRLINIGNITANRPISLIHTRINKMNEVTNEVEVTEVHGITREDIAGLDKNQAFRFLMIEKNLEQDQINKIWSTFGDKNKGGVFGAFLKFLEAKPQTASDLATFLLSDKSSSNEVRWFNQRDSIRELSVKIFTDLGVEFVEVPVTAEQKTAMETVVKNVDKVNAAKKAAKIAFTKAAKEAEAAEAAKAKK